MLEINREINYHYYQNLQYQKSKVQKNEGVP